MKIAIIGECMVELSESSISNHILQGFGGDTLNTAIYLSRLSSSIDVHFVTGIGVDILSQKLQRAWKDEKLILDHVLTFDHLTLGLYWIMTDQKGERSFLYWRKNSAASQWLKHSKVLDTLTQLMQMDWIYLSGISLAILDSKDRRFLLDWLILYRAQGGKVIFDSNYREVLWQSASEAESVHNQMLEIIDIALLTDEDEMKILGVQYLTILKNITKKRDVTIIIKQGADGALILKDDRKKVIDAVRVNTVIDSTAAGDSFNAGVIAGLLEGETLDRAVLLGHRLASVVIQHKGAIIPADAMTYEQFIN